MQIIGDSTFEKFVLLRIHVVRRFDSTKISFGALGEFI